MNSPDPSAAIPAHPPAPGAPAGRVPLIALDGIVKTYGAVRALRGFSMAVQPGEVVGIIGENGAGKSTLMKVLGGLVTPDAGAITIDGGPPLASLTVAASFAAGIAFVHQELNLFDNLDVAANVLIGREPRRGGPLRLVDRARQRERVAPILRRLGASFGPDTAVASLSLAQRQMVEIARALSTDARLVILDEPTSSLPAAETEKLLEVIAGLRADGIAVLFISHRLHEVERAVDRLVALRDGSLAGGLERADITHDRMVRMMVGRDLMVDRAESRAPGRVVLRAEGVETALHPGRAATLAIHAGEVLGLAGLVGAGRTELARVLFGIDRPVAGRLVLDDRPLPLGSAADAVARGIFLVPEDRKASGLVLDFSIQHNISLPSLRRHARNTIIRPALEAETASRQRDNLGIKAGNLSLAVRTLSGGNQQKVAIAKWLAMEPRVVILDEPTRGIDVGAKAEIYRLMRALADAGVAILMISSDMEEVLGASDRIAVMDRGVIAGVLERARFSEENVLRLAVGSPVEGETVA